MIKNKPESGMYGGLTKVMKECDSGKMERPAKGKMIETIQKSTMPKMNPKEIEKEKAEMRIAILKK